MDRIGQKRVEQPVSVRDALNESAQALVTALDMRFGSVAVSIRDGQPRAVEPTFRVRFAGTDPLPKNDSARWRSAAAPLVRLAVTECGLRTGQIGFFVHEGEVCGDLELAYCSENHHRGNGREPWRILQRVRHHKTKDERKGA